MLKRTRSIIEKIKRKSSVTRIVVVVAVAMVGTYFLLQTQAAPIPIEFNGNNAKIENKATLCTDQTVGGNIVQFGSANTLPLPYIAVPLPNATISGTQALSAGVENYIVGQKVRFWRDGLNIIGNAVKDPNFGHIFSWDTTQVSNGVHTLSVSTFKPNGEQCFSPTVTVTVNNPQLTNGDRLGFAVSQPLLADGLTVDQYVDKVASMGTKWFRFNAGDTEALLTAAKRNNLKVLYALNHRPGNNSTEAWVNQEMQYVNSVQQKFPGVVKAYEIINEPNNPAYGVIQPTKIADMMRQIYPKLKQANPSATVVSGGLTPGGGNDPCCNGNVVNPADYVDQIYKANNNTSNGMFDAVGHHPYETRPAGSDGSGNLVDGGFRATHYVRAVMNKYDDWSKQIWATEAGTPSCGPYGAGPVNGLTEAERAIRFNGDMKDLFSGLHNSDGSPKGTYAARGDWNVHSFFIFKLYKNGNTEPADNNLGIIHTPSRNCFGHPAWYEPPLIGAIKAYSATNQ